MHQKDAVIIKGTMKDVHILFNWSVKDLLVKQIPDKKKEQRHVE